MLRKPSIISDFVYSSNTELVRVDIAGLVEYINFLGNVCILNFLELGQKKQICQQKLVNSNCTARGFQARAVQGGSSKAQ